MALTKDFKQTVMARAQRDPAFRHALLIEAVERLLEGDVTAAKGGLRDYINAAIGFETLAGLVGIPSKSLHRMLGPRGNPSLNHFSVILNAVQATEHIGLIVRAEEALPAAVNVNLPIPSGAKVFRIDVYRNVRSTSSSTCTELVMGHG